MDWFQFLSFFNEVIFRRDVIHNIQWYESASGIVVVVVVICKRYKQLHFTQLLELFTLL